MGRVVRSRDLRDARPIAKRHSFEPLKQRYEVGIDAIRERFRQLNLCRRILLRNSWNSSDWWWILDLRTTSSRQSPYLPLSWKVRCQPNRLRNLIFTKQYQYNIWKVIKWELELESLLQKLSAKGFVN